MLMVFTVSAEKLVLYKGKARIQKVLSEVVQKFRFFFNFCLVFIFDPRGERNRTNILCGPPSARQRNVISMAFHWLANDGNG